MLGIIFLGVMSYVYGNWAGGAFTLFLFAYWISTTTREADEKRRDDEE